MRFAWHQVIAMSVHRFTGRLREATGCHTHIERGRRRRSVPAWIPDNHILLRILSDDGDGAWIRAWPADPITTDVLVRTAHDSGVVIQRIVRPRRR